MKIDPNSNFSDIKRAIRTIDPKKAINFANILNLFRPTNLVMRRFFKPDLIIRRRAREIRNIVSKTPINYDLLEEYATDLLIASNKAKADRENKKK
jgi:hypothetical protein